MHPRPCLPVQPCSNRAIAFATFLSSRYSFPAKVHPAGAPRSQPFWYAERAAVRSLATPFPSSANCPAHKHPTAYPRSQLFAMSAAPAGAFVAMPVPSKRSNPAWAQPRPSPFWQAATKSWWARAGSLATPLPSWRSLPSWTHPIWSPAPHAFWHDWASPQACWAVAEVSALATTTAAMASIAAAAIRHRRGARAGELLRRLVGAADIDDGFVANVFDIDRRMEPLPSQSALADENRTAHFAARLARSHSCSIALGRSPSPSGGAGITHRLPFGAAPPASDFISNFAASASSTKRGMVPR